MSNPPLNIALAVILRNEEKNLPGLLQSFSDGLLTHMGSGESCHFIFVDNNSEDASVEIIKTWQSDNPKLRISLIERSRNHMAEARNQALDCANSDWIAFIDGDSRLAKNWWPQVKRVLREVGDEVWCVGGGTPYLIQKKWHEYAQSLESYFPLGRDEFRKIPVDNVATNNCLLRRDKVIDRGGFDMSFAYVGEDLELCLRLGGKKHVLYHPIFQAQHLLPENMTDWFRKMALYGRAQSFVAFRHPRRMAKEKLIPFFLLLIITTLIFWAPLFTLSLLTLLLISQRVRFYVLTFAFYGLGEIVGFFISLYPQRKTANFFWESRKA